MTTHASDLIELAVQNGALKFGSFTLKSGRISPYFFNAGALSTGLAISRLGDLYADALIASGLEFDFLFGPAYKGIPLVAAVAISLAIKFGKDLPYAYNRKETKDHGEGGLLVGGDLLVQGGRKVVIIDDVITAGTAIREAVNIVTQQTNKVVGVVVALDRQERGEDISRSAVQQVEADLSLKVISVANLDTLLEWVEGGKAEELKEKIREYRLQYRVSN